MTVIDHHFLVFIFTILLGVSSWLLKQAAQPASSVVTQQKFYEESKQGMNRASPVIKASLQPG